MMDIQLNTNAACRVVGIDPDRLNEHVAAGRYPCTPQTIRGKARVFGFHDLLSLWLFRVLMGKSYSVKSAGYFACAITEMVRSHPDTDLVSIVELLNGSRVVVLGGSGAIEWDCKYSGEFISDVHTFNIKQILALIARRGEDESSQ